MSRERGQQRDDVEKTAHRAEAVKLYLRGVSQVEIAAQLNLSPNTVRADLTYVRKLWLAAALRDFDQAKAQELARIDHLEATYWESWEQSRQRRPANLVQAFPELLTPGDKRWLEGVQWCIEQRCQILGLHAPQKTVGLHAIIPPGGIDSAKFHTPEANELAHQLLAVVAGTE